MFRLWKDMFAALVVVVGGFCVVTPFFGLAAWASYTTCHNRADLMEMPAEWGVLQGCMVKYNGKWLPLNNLRGIDQR